MKNVTFVVEFTTELQDNINPEDVTFDIDVGFSKIRPIGFDGLTVGTVIGYSTVNHFNDDVDLGEDWYDENNR